MFSLSKALYLAVVLLAGTLQLAAAIQLPGVAIAQKARLAVHARQNTGINMRKNKKKRSSGKQGYCSGRKSATTALTPPIVITPAAVIGTSTTSSVAAPTNQAPASKPSPPASIPTQISSNGGGDKPVSQPAVVSNLAPTTSAAPPPAPPVAPDSSSDSGGTDSGGLTAAQQADFLQLHNSIRSQHGAVALTWSDSLAGTGKGWADKCVFKHSGGTLGPFGENLAAGTGPSYDVNAAMTSWTSEISQYDASNPVASHYTQVVWKGTTQVGCGLAPACSGIFNASFGPTKYFVCEYLPQGNIDGEFQENVQ